MSDIFHSTRQATARKGFTLLEVLVVITIIIIIAVAAIPAFRFITGSRSIESTQNIVAAMIGRARSQALTDRGHRGVFFFVDPVNDRTTMALVEQGSAGELGQYSGWATAKYTPNQPIDAPAVVVNPIPTPWDYYAPGNAPNARSMVVSLTTNANYADNNRIYLGLNRSAVLQYGSIQNHKADYANEAGTGGGKPYWGQLSTSIDVIADTDFQLLPSGVGAQLINSNPANVASFDRYLRIGCIMFDKNGRFESVPWSVKSASTLGSALHLVKDLDLPNTLYSQFGVVLYDRQTFLAKDPTNNPSPTEGDLIFNSTFFDPAIYSAAGFPANAAVESQEELWLDNNSLPLLIDRYNGTIIKGE